MRDVFIYRMNGQCIGFMRNEILYSADGKYLGWGENNSFWNNHGQFCGQLYMVNAETNTAYILKNQFSIPATTQAPRYYENLSGSSIPAMPAPIQPVLFNPSYKDGF